MRSRLPLIALVVALALAGCASDRDRVGAAGSPTPSIGDIATLVPGATPSTPGPGGTTTSSPKPGTSPSAASTAPGPSPAPLDPATVDHDVPVQGIVTPSCVVRGGTATINIHTAPKNAVAYHAVYAGTKGGAPPPFGYGYGGDDRGHADGEGNYTSTWIVRIDAPVGPARADVIAADGESFGYDDPGFYVAASSAGCPA